MPALHENGILMSQKVEKIKQKWEKNYKMKDFLINDVDFLRKK